MGGGGHGAWTAYPIGGYTAALERMSEDERLRAAFEQARQIFPELAETFEGGVAHCWGLQQWQKGSFALHNAGQIGFWIRWGRRKAGSTSGRAYSGVCGLDAGGVRVGAAGGAGSECGRDLLRNSRKTESGARQFLTRSEERAAPFALLGNSRQNGPWRRRCCF